METRQRKRYGRKGLASDRTGALEGLPLYLVILVLISGIAAVVLMGWFSQPDNKSIGEVHVTPTSIVLDEYTSNPGVYRKTGIAIKVIVRDSDGNPLDRASVKVEGMGIHWIENNNQEIKHTGRGITDKDGEVTIGDLRIMNALSGGEVTVTVHRSGYGVKAQTIPVVLRT